MTTEEKFEGPWLPLLLESELSSEPEPNPESPLVSGCAGIFLPNSLMVIPHAAPVAAMKISRITILKIEKNDTPPTDNRCRHDFFTDEVELDVAFGFGLGFGFAAGGGVVVLDSVAGTLSVRSAGCRAGNGEWLTGESCRLSGVLGDFGGT